MCIHTDVVDSPKAKLITVITRIIAREGERERDSAMQFTLSDNLLVEMKAIRINFEFAFHYFNMYQLIGYIITAHLGN